MDAEGPLARAQATRLQGAIWLAIGKPAEAQPAWHFVTRRRRTCHVAPR